MATPTNLENLVGAGLGGGLAATKPSDLVVAVAGTDAACDAALALADELLAEQLSGDGGSVAEQPPSSMQMAVSRDPALNFALISVPGDYAAAEAMKALRLGMSVMVFSDNVPEEQELAIKQYAAERGLMVMGPDCGTAIVNGLPLGFANVVRRGPIGVVGASGTGMQEVTSRIHNLGSGISQALGTGGHDLSDAIGGISMLQACARSSAIPTPGSSCWSPSRRRRPSPAGARRRPGDGDTGGRDLPRRRPGLVQRRRRPRRGDAGRRRRHGGGAGLGTARRAGRARPRPGSPRHARRRRAAHGAGPALRPRHLLRRHVLLRGAAHPPGRGHPRLVQHPGRGQPALDDIRVSREHTIVDMGDDEFTQGRPHPMIDPSLRNERIARDAADPATAVLLVDVVLGYGSAADPTSRLTRGARPRPQSARNAGRHLAVIAHVCGTDADPQNRRDTIARLQAAGALVASSNAEAAAWAAHLATRLAAR